MPDESNDIEVRRSTEIVQRETLRVESQRGTGTNDRDSVKKTIEREAELDVPDDDLQDFPTLIGRTDEGRALGEVAETMAEIRETNNDNE